MDKTLNIEELFYALKKRIRIIIIVTLSLTLVGSLQAMKMKPSYEARVKIFAGKTAEVQGDYSSNELNSYTQLIGSYIEIIKTEDFMNKVIKKAKLDMTPAQMAGALSFTTSNSAPILNISYRGGDPEIAEKIVSTLSTEFESGVKEIILNTYTKVIDSVKVVTYYPNKTRVILLGFVAGLILGIGVVLVLDYLDDSIVRKEELEKLIPVPVLGEIGLEDDQVRSSKRRKKKNKGVS